MTAVDACTAGIWERGQRGLTVGLLLTISIAAFEALAVATVLPVTVRDLGGLGWYGWVFSGFMLTSLVSITVGGGLADQHGPARPFALGCGLFVVGLVIAGLAPSMAVVVLGRMAQGCGAGAISSVAYVAVARAYRTSEQPRMLAMLSSAWVVPGLIGPAVAGTVADTVGWRWVFLGLAPLAALAGSFALTGLRRLGPAAAAAADARRIRSAVYLAVGTGSVLLGVENRSPWPTAVLVAIGLAIGLPALRYLMPAGTLRARPGLPAAVASMALLSFAFFGAEAFLPLALLEVRAQPVTIAGLALTAGTLAWSAGAWMQARLDARRDRCALVRTGLALTFTGIAGIASVLPPSTPVIVATLSWAVAGLGIGLSYSTITLIVLDHASTGHEGTAAAALQLANVLGVALGTGLGGAALALAMGAGHSQVFGLGVIDAIMMAAAALGVVAARRLPRRHTSVAGTRDELLCAPAHSD